METLRRSIFFLLPLLLSAGLVEPSFPNLFDLLGPRNPDDDLLGNGTPSTSKPNEQAADYETNYGGKWEMMTENAGVSAMHLVIMPSNKAIMFDSTIFQPSVLKLPDGYCRTDINDKQETYQDCWSHGVEFDLQTAQSRPLRVLTDTWCSSGGLDVNGNLVQSGGFKAGGRAVRYYTSCFVCDWREYPTALNATRWYGTQQMLPDGTFIVIGGRKQFNYEFIPAEGQANPTAYDLPLLRETNDIVENNLYPFVHLAPDGNLFIFANNRAILFDPSGGRTVREFPPLEGGARNYPSSGMSALLPIQVRDNGQVTAEVVVCGGTPPDAFSLGEKGIFPEALKSCGRISITNPNSDWQIEQMPMGRTLGDMLILPNTDLLLINGASQGCAGWWFARDPVFNPVLYRPTLPQGDRFRTLAPTTIARVYHSTSALLPDGSIMVAGSNTNDRYNYQAQFPTEVNVEKYYPPYFDPELDTHRPQLYQHYFGMRYGQRVSLEFMMPTTEEMVEKEDIKVTMYAPPFTTHGFSMNQRLLVLNIENLSSLLLGRYRVDATAPPYGAIAPPGYYLVFVVNRGVPSNGIWVQIK